MFVCIFPLFLPSSHCYTSNPFRINANFCYSKAFVFIFLFCPVWALISIFCYRLIAVPRKPELLLRAMSDVGVGVGGRAVLLCFDLERYRSCTAGAQFCDWGFISRRAGETGSRKAAAPLVPSASSPLPQLSIMRAARRQRAAFTAGCR